MENEKGLKKVKFYDWVFTIYVVSFIISISLLSLSDKFIYILYTLFFITNISSITFKFGIIYWILKNKNIHFIIKYPLILFSIFIIFIPFVYYFSVLRSKFKEGDF